MDETWNHFPPPQEMESRGRVDLPAHQSPTCFGSFLLPLAHGDITSLQRHQRCSRYHELVPGSFQALQNVQRQVLKAQLDPPRHCELTEIAIRQTARQRVLVPRPPIQHEALVHFAQRGVRSHLDPSKRPLRRQALPLHSWRRSCKQSCAPGVGDSRCPKATSAARDASSFGGVDAQPDSPPALNKQGKSSGVTSRLNHGARKRIKPNLVDQPPRTTLPGSHLASVLNASGGASHSC